MSMDTEDFVVGAIYTMIVFMIALFTGIHFGRCDMKDQAVKAKVAHYVVNESTGVVKFEFYECLSIDTETGKINIEKKVDK